MDVWKIGDGSDILALLEDELRGGEVMATLYPINAKHTSPMVRGISKAMARCHAICDIVSDIEPTDEEVHNNATIAFRAFCESQESNSLTDDVEALETMYISAYEEMYHQRYAEIIANLEKIAEQRNLNCAD